MFPNYTHGSGFAMTVPHQTPISPHLSNGTQIHISGTPTGSRFEVNLRTYQNDVILHVNPRVDDRVLVLNSSQQGRWANEERHSLTLQRGMRITMVIMVTDHGYKISINNAHICEFHHRAPMHSAQTLEVKGDITLESAQVYPASMGVPSMGVPSMGFPQMNVSMPYVQPPPTSFSTGGFGYPSVPAPVNPMPGFPMGGGAVPSIQRCHLHTGSRIFVRGYVNPGAQRFEINLLQGHHDNNDIAFHFNPRFDQNKIVKNHRKNGQWGSEENQPFPQYMPLTPGSPVDLQIACLHDRYTIYMNNILIAEYFHKMPAGSVQAVQYKGDITVTSIGQL